MSAKILIIEDDHAVNELLANGLTSQGYDVYSSYDGLQGVLQARENHFDLILLDMLLPSLDGLDVLQKIREKKQTPVLILTAKGAEEDRIRGFKSGADDYLTKPFSMPELILRVEAILRRTLVHKRVPTSQKNAPFYIDPRQGTISVNGHELALTPLEFNLLQALLHEKGKTLSKPYLYQIVLHKEYSRFDRTLDMHISNIRKKLTSAGIQRDLIKTIHGRGYTLVC